MATECTNVDRFATEMLKEKLGSTPSRMRRAKSHRSSSVNSGTNERTIGCALDQLQLCFKSSIFERSTSLSSSAQNWGGCLPLRRVSTAATPYRRASCSREPSKTATASDSVSSLSSEIGRAHV